MTEKEKIAENWKLWAWRMQFLEDCPESEVNQLKEEIFAVWGNAEKKTYWTWRIGDEADFSRELLALGSQVTQRIKAQARMAA